MGRRFVRFFTLVAVVSTLAILTACGGNASPAPTSSSNPSPTPTAGTTPPSSGGGTSTTPPSTTPPPGGSGSGTSGSPSVNNTTVWQASFIAWSDQQLHGQVTVDADGATGNGTYQFNGIAANSSYTFRFCMGFASALDCFDIATGTTDAAGAANGSFHFVPPTRWGAPQSQYDGVFLVDLSGQRSLVTSWNLTSSTTMFSSQLFRLSSPDINSVGPTSGRVTVAGGVVHVQLRGARPNTAFDVGQQDTINSHSGHTIGTLTTDASGNADADFHSDQPGWSVSVSYTPPYQTPENYSTGFAIK